MEDQSQQSCWGVMAWTVIVLGGALMVVSLLGGFDTAAVVAAR